MSNINLNLQAERIKNEIYNIINNSQLPGALIYYIFKDILINIEKEYFHQLQKQQNKQQKQQQGEED